MYRKRSNRRDSFHLKTRIALLMSTTNSTSINVNVTHLFYMFIPSTTTTATSTIWSWSTLSSLIHPPNQATNKLNIIIIIITIFIDTTNGSSPFLNNHHQFPIWLFHLLRRIIFLFETFWNESDTDIITNTTR